ncbi:MAG: LysR family transcriptional regulator [Thiohalorhabdaceae bacterium]
MDWQNHTPPIRGLMALRAVAENGTFTHAARALGWNQPNVSKHLQTLERTVGKRLVRREQGGTVLTPAGAKVLEQAVRITDAYAELMDDLETPSPNRGPAERLRVAASPTLGTYWLARLVSDRQGAWPEIPIETRTLPGREALRRLAQGRENLALVEHPPDDADLVGERIGSHRLLAACHASHPWAGVDSIAIADFLRASLVLREPGCELRDGLERRLRQEGHAALVADRVVGSDTTLLAQLHQGEHLTVTSSLALASEWGRDLVSLPIRDLDLSRPIWAVYDPRTLASEGLTTFLAHLRSHPIGGNPETGHPDPGETPATADSFTG